MLATYISHIDELFVNNGVRWTSVCVNSATIRRGMILPVRKAQFINHSIAVPAYQYQSTNLLNIEHFRYSSEADNSNSGLISIFLGQVY